MTPFFKVLSRDSEFFECKVARLIDNSLNLEERKIESELKKMFNEKVTLGYYYSKKLIPNNFKSKYYDLKLVDEKITLTKPLNSSAYIHSNITLYQEGFPNKKLIALAQLAGRFTRFNFDANISRDKYNELFRNWMIESVEGKMASHVLVYKIENKIIGFVAIKKDSCCPHISLLAVDPKFEGKGVSFALLLAAEKILLDEGFKFISGSVHRKNVKALVVYYRHGPEDQKIEYGYHLWRKK
jgi:dTDP-4-amino-4,6-dideoxy-D-galactose acyltransferase